METREIVVIGGSANGSRAAREAAFQEADVLVLEEHPRIGMPEHCSGLFSYQGLTEIDAFPPDNVILNHEIFGARLFSPKGTGVVVRKSTTHALVADRAKFDQFVARLATMEGAEVRTSNRVLSVEKTSDGWFLKVLDREENAEYMIRTKGIIDAEGFRGVIAQQMGFAPYPENKIINAAQYYIRGIEDIDSQLVEVYQTPEFAPSFFGWLIPIDGKTAKVGLGTSRKHAGKELQRMLEKYPPLRERLENTEIYYRIAGKIPIHGPRKKTVTNGAVLVGDVAGQTKPTTGGGVIIGGIAAKIAGEVMAKAVKENDVRGKRLKEYENRWKEKLWSNLRSMRWVRKYLNGLSVKRTEELFRILSKPRIQRIIEEVGDVDNQSPIIWRMLFQPSLLSFYLKTSPQAIKAVL